MGERSHEAARLYVDLSVNLDALDSRDLNDLASSPLPRRATWVVALGGALLSIPIVATCGLARDALNGMHSTMVVVATFAAVIAYFVGMWSRREWHRVFWLAPVGGAALAVTAGTVCTIGASEHDDSLGAVMVLCFIYGVLPGAGYGSLCSAALWFPLRTAHRAMQEGRLDGASRADRANAVWLFAVSVVVGVAHVSLDVWFVGVWASVIGIGFAAWLAMRARRERASCRELVLAVRAGERRDLRIDSTGRFLERAAEALDYRGEVHAWKQVARVD